MSPVRAADPLYIGSAAGRADQGPRVGSALLSTARTDVRGREVTLPERQPTVVLFADIKCELCAEIRDQCDVLDPHAERIKVIIFCVGPVTDVRAWSARTPGYVHVVWDEGSAAAYRYKVDTLPFAVAVGSDGLVRAKSIINGREGLTWAAEQASALPAVDDSKPSEVVVQT